MQASTLRTIAFILMFTGTAQGAAPSGQVIFGPEGLNVSGLKPGTKLVWLALTRERRGYHSVLGTSRGIEIATPAGAVPIGHRGADRSRSLWLLASVDGEFATTGAPPGYAMSSIPIEVTVASGAKALTVVSPSVEVLYVRPRGGAWFASVGDGSAADADTKQDTNITITLQSLQPFQGNPNPPDAAAEGDLILIMDPLDNRIAVVKVAR